MEVHYFALNQPQAEKILANQFPKNWRWTPFASDAKTPIVFLFSPLWCHEHYVSADISWNAYLAKRQPEAKLISIGFHAIQRHNYIDLLLPPKNLAIFLEESKSCAEDWLPVDTWGIDINQKLKRFFDGHGNESVRESLNGLLRRFRMVKDEVNAGTPYEEIYQELLVPTHTTSGWQKLVNRWQAYYPFFICLPFWHFFKQTNRLLLDIQPFFDQDCQSYDLLVALKVVEKIEFVNQLLKEAEQYVQKEPPYLDRR